MKGIRRKRNRVVRGTERKVKEGERQRQKARMLESQKAKNRKGSWIPLNMKSRLGKIKIFGLEGKGKQRKARRKDACWKRKKSEGYQNFSLFKNKAQSQFYIENSCLDSTDFRSVPFSFSNQHSKTHACMYFPLHTVLACSTYTA